ncbi:MAG: radical SAM protein [Cyanobacteria bacterium SZAS-4]|nr:radical SAM protein [Cyanobacteria bacterium SZAS-4]
MKDKRFKIIYLELTNACNFSCDYCPIDQQTRKKEMMDTDFAKSIIDQIADNELTDFITFHLMGEPFLHKELAALTGYSEARNLRVRLLTNGSLLESARNVQLFENNCTRLEVGFRTPNDTAFNLRLRGGKLTLDDYIYRVKGLIEDKIQTGAKTEVCLKFFIRSHAAMLGMAEEYEHLTSEADNLKVANLFRDHTFEMARKYNVPIGEWANVPVKVVDGEYFIFPGISLAFARIQEFWVREQRAQVEGTTHKAIIGGCSAAFRDDFGILASGEVTTCCIDYDGKNVIGDLHKQSLMEVLESKEAKRMLRSFDFFIPPTEFCKECRGGPTVMSSVTKQIGTIAIDIKDRLAPRKHYRALRNRLAKREQGTLTTPKAPATPATPPAPAAAPKEPVTPSRK